jgi:ribonuclease HII
MRKFDNSFRTDTFELIAGSDEVGRGPLAGPVVAASVIFPKKIYIKGIRDSKILTEGEREKVLPKILEKSIVVSVAVISHAEIDRINILQASLLAMYNSLCRLKVQPHLVLVDGNKGFDYPVPVIPVIKGDSKSFTIAAASIVAKVARDRIMKRLCPIFPQYLWSKNKGYPTKEHIQAIRIFGPSPLHRKTFLRKILEENPEPELEFEKKTSLR